MPLDVDGGHIATGFVGVVGAWVSIRLARLRRRDSVEARYEKLRASILEEIREENATLRERVAVVENTLREREDVIEHLTVALRMIVAEIQLHDPQSVILGRVRTYLNSAFPLTKTPPDMLALLAELELRERGG